MFCCLVFLWSDNFLPGQNFEAEKQNKEIKYLEKIHLRSKHFFSKAVEPYNVFQIWCLNIGVFRTK